ncbi:unnamed protein product [Effrenium voratum]|uniref:Uncharacterized protein n=1 Tax=Effrenium voratum TaxID=2562239 RepID=A0AA36IXV2_9DINO|nr:unnamed protein product [Effrenium voratum]
MCDRSIRDPDVPWLEESPLTATIPQSVTVQQQVWFYRPDLFHTCHKGLMAELAGSALVSMLDLNLDTGGGAGNIPDRMKPV